MKLPPECLVELDRIPAVSVTTISGDAVARKLQAISDLRDRECAEELEGFPWLREAMWFLSWQSQQPGGLGLSREAALTLRTLAEGVPQTVTAELEREIVSRATGTAAWIQYALAATRVIPEHLANACQTPGRPFILGADSLWQWDHDSLLEILGDGAVGVLGLTPEKLPGDWFLGSLLTVLQLAMADQAKAAHASIAPTSVSRLLFDELDFALRERRPVAIHGSARHGKTDSLAAWVSARPGLARLVTVPPGQRERDMLVAMADALGISHTPTTTPLQLSAQVAYALKWGRLFLVFDEAHNLWPPATNRHTVPKRLNFIRDLVLDKVGCGCAFVSTPQSYKRIREDFLERTGYAIEQWDGRVGAPLCLPNELPKEDLAAVGLHLCPEIGEQQLWYLVDLAVASEGYLGRMVRFLQRAAGIARQSGRTVPNLSDIEAAVLRETGVAAVEILALAAARIATPPVPKPARHPTRTATTRSTNARGWSLAGLVSRAGRSISGGLEFTTRSTGSSGSTFSLPQPVRSRSRCCLIWASAWPRARPSGCRRFAPTRMPRRSPAVPMLRWSV